LATRRSPPIGRESWIRRSQSDILTYLDKPPLDALPLLGRKLGDHLI